MKSYRLVKEFPGSPKLGYIANQDEFAYMMDYPEFWEEIIEKQWEIIDGYCHKLMMFAKPTDWNIKSIKRLSDNTTFSVGDMIVSNNPNCRVTNTEPIESIKINKNGIPCLFTKSFKNNGLGLFNAIKRYPVFATEDGYEIYVGDMYFMIHEFKTCQCVANRHVIHSPSVKRFKFEEAAKNWIKLNKPIYSLNDILEMQQRNNIPMLNLLNKK